MAGRIVGIGGVFFKSPDHKALREWYHTRLGIGTGGDFAMFPWRPAEGDGAEKMTVWTVFPAASDYFNPSGAPFMINYIVEDLDGLLESLGAQGVRIDPKREDLDYGKFAWIFDPDGNKIELWEPR